MTLQLRGRPYQSSPLPRKRSGVTIHNFPSTFLCPSTPSQRSCFAW